MQQMDADFILDQLYLLVSNSMLLLGFSLCVMNFYGLLFRDLRVSNIKTENLRFGEKNWLSYDEALRQSRKKKTESSMEYAERLTSVINSTIAHIHWEKYHPDRFYQRIPIWENYFLYLIGRVTGKPELNRYHIANYKRSLKRGIGVCGDSAMIMAQLLTKNNIDNRIISFKDHVVVEAVYDENTRLVYDPDFGVVLPYSISSVNSNPQMITKHYVDKGFSNSEIRFLIHVMKKEFKVWNDVRHFITRRYYLETISYLLKWPFPVLLMLFAARSINWLY